MWVAWEWGQCACGLILRLSCGWPGNGASVLVASFWGSRVWVAWEWGQCAYGPAHLGDCGLQYGGTLVLVFLLRQL